MITDEQMRDENSVTVRASSTFPVAFLRIAGKLRRQLSGGALSTLKKLQENRICDVHYFLALFFPTV